MDIQVRQSTYTSMLVRTSSFQEQIRRRYLRRQARSL